MFIHNFKYTFLTLLKNKMLIFWTFAFPIILALFFNMAFANIENSEKLSVIDIAIVNNDSFKDNFIYQQVFKALSDDTQEEQLFNIKYGSEEEVKELLNNKEIVGYLKLEDGVKIVVNFSGIDETIFKYVVDEIIQNERIVKEILEEKLEGNGLLDKAKIYKEITNLINREVKIKDVSSNNLSYTMIEYYTLIAMTCLYGGILGMSAINNALPNMSNLGKRVSIAPTKKSVLVISSALAAYVIQLIGLFLLFLFTILVIKVDYGNNLALIILLTMLGALTGLTLGLMIASIIKKDENLKTGIIISVSMLGSFLAGMMGITMKYVIDKNVPIVNVLNPVNMITDGFYSLYYYESLNKFFFNVGSLVVTSLIFIGLSIMVLRRAKYDSI